MSPRPKHAKVYIEEYVCHLYEPVSTDTRVSDDRWNLFSKKQLEGNKLPPTQGALIEGIRRAYYQAKVWMQDIVSDPQLLLPRNMGGGLRTRVWYWSTPRKCQPHMQ